MNARAQRLRSRIRDFPHSQLKSGEIGCQGYRWHAARNILPAEWSPWVSLRTQTRLAVDVANVCDCAPGDRAAKPATAPTAP